MERDERDDGVNGLLASYPRQRPELPAEHQRSYVEHYRSNRSDKQGLSKVVQRLESWMHRAVARGVAGGNLLEIGAGNLNHVRYQADAQEYDAIEPFRELWQDSQYRGRVTHIYDDILNVPEGTVYDHILSIAVLEHLTDLPFMLARSAMLLKDGGDFRAGFPSEGALLWGISWRMTTGLKYRWDRGLDYGAIMRHEHVNTAAEILALLGYFYTKVEIVRFPLPFAQLSFYTVAVACGPRLDRCQAQYKARLSAPKPEPRPQRK